MLSYWTSNMLFLFLLLWSVGCLSGKTTTASESPDDSFTVETTSKKHDAPWFTRAGGDLRDSSDDTSTDDFFGFFSTLHLGPRPDPSLWSTETLEEEFSMTVSESEAITTTEATATTKETTTTTAGVTFEMPTLELPTVSSTSVYKTPSFTTLLRPTTTREESPTPEVTTGKPPSGPSSIQIIGIVAGSIASLVIVVVVILLCRRRRRRAAASRRPTIRLVSGPVPDPTARSSQTYLPVMRREVVDSRDLLAGVFRGSGSPPRRSDEVSELTPSERDTIDRVVDGYTSSVYSQDSEQQQPAGARSGASFSH